MLLRLFCLGFSFANLDNQLFWSFYIRVLLLEVVLLTQSGVFLICHPLFHEKDHSNWSKLVLSISTSHLFSRDHLLLHIFLALSQWLFQLERCLDTEPTFAEENNPDLFSLWEECHINTVQQFCSFRTNNCFLQVFFEIEFRRCCFLFWQIFQKYFSDLSQGRWISNTGLNIFEEINSRINFLFLY